MSNPLFWLGLSLGLLAVSLVVLVVLAVPTLVSLARTAHSAERLLDMLNRELPATLKALRQTGAELGNLADDVSNTAHSARQIVGQVDHGIATAQRQAMQAQRTSRSLWAGARAAWKVLTASPQTPSQRPPRKRKPYPPTRRPATPPLDTLPLNAGESIPSQTADAPTQPPADAAVKAVAEVDAPANDLASQ